MLCGHSALHVNQTEGIIYSKNKVEGYYNNLTEKITRFGLEGDEIPKVYVDTGEEIVFSIAVFQYGIAAYDLYLLNHDDSMLGKLKACADWATENMQPDGGWSTFDFEYPDFPYSSMAQGEGISLLLRAGIAFNDNRYLQAAHKAKDFMLKPIISGGTTLYKDNDALLYEYPVGPLVLNGWIFSAWGLYDYAKYFNDSEAMMVWNRMTETIAKYLPIFDCGYWSMYNDANTIASPFYHSLHIAQLNVMYDLTGIETYRLYAEKWNKNRNNWWNRKRAFIRKAMQKVLD